MLEGIVGQAGEPRAARARRAAAAFERDRVEVGDAALAPATRASSATMASRRRRDARARSAGSAPSRPGQQLGDRARRRAVLRQDQDAPPRREMQAQRVERPAVQAQRRAIGERPAEPRGGEAEGAGLRQDRHLLARESGGPGSTPTPYHIGSPLASTTTRRPRRAAIAAIVAASGLPPDRRSAAPGRHHRQMARAADQHLGGLDQRARRRREPGEPVLADADDGEPGLTPSPASALTAAAASALPPRRPASAMKASPPEVGERRLGLGGADKADRKAEHQRRLRRAVGEHLEQMEQRGRRVADRDHRAGEMRPPQLDRGGRAGRRLGCRRAAQSRDRRACR